MPTPRTKEPPSERELFLIEQLAHVRWGPTGFCCRHCGHLHAWSSRTRPRVRECRSCGRSCSVTAGTLLHGTRLPLEVWVRRGIQFESSVQIQSVTALAATFGIARSTAWLLHQKMFALLSFGADPHPGAKGATIVRNVRVRRPSRAPPMAETAPKHVRLLHLHHLNLRLRGVTVPIVMRLIGCTSWRVHVAPTREEAVEYQHNPPDWLVAHDHYGLNRWLHASLELLPHTVSLRWLPRWLDAALAGWNIANARIHPPPWDLTAVRCGPRPLKALDPWKRAA